MSSLMPEESQMILKADDCPKMFSLFENDDSIIFVVSKNLPPTSSASTGMSADTEPSRIVLAIIANDNMEQINEDFKTSLFGFELALGFQNELNADFVSFLAYSPDHENHSHHFLENWVTARYNLAAHQSQPTDQKEVTIKIAKIFEALNSIEYTFGRSVLAQTPSLNISSNENHQSRDLINAWKIWMQIEPHEALLINNNFKKDSIALTISALESIFEKSFISIQDHCRKTDMVKYNCEIFDGDCTNELISLGKRF